MAKYELRVKARSLRSQGVSVKNIAEILGIAKATASVWVRDIILSVEQLEALKQAEIRGAALGRLRGSLAQKNKRLQLIKDSKTVGIAKIGKLNRRELLIAGLALYWGEGSKKKQSVSFCNSDPEMIKFLLRWLKECFGITSDELVGCVGINEMHEKREGIVKEYWSKITGIPLRKFRKTSFKKVKNKKIYENYDEHYGVFTVTLLKPAKRYFSIIGLIEGLKGNSQGSSMVEHFIHNEAVMGPIPIPGTKV